MRAMKLASAFLSAALALLSLEALGPTRAVAGPAVNPLEDTSVYPIAVWAMLSSTAAPFSELGVNIFVAGESNARGWCDTLAASGCVGFVHWRSRRTPEERAEIVASPGFLGWMHGDEPDNADVVDDVFLISRIPPEQLQANFDELKASSTPAPMYLNLGQGLANGINQTTPDSVYPAYCRTADIVCYDVYPTSTQEKGTSRLHLVARGVERLRRFAGPDKPLWIWLECTAIRGTMTGIGNRAPLPHEVRAQVWMSIIHGADGIGYFPHQFDPYRGGPRAIPANVQAEMKLTNGLLHQLAPVLRDGRRERLEVDAVDGWVSAASWRLDDQAVVAVVNMRDEAGTAAVHLPAGLGVLEPLGRAGLQAGGACPCQEDAAQVAQRPGRDPSAGVDLDLALRPYEVAVFVTDIEPEAVDYRYPRPGAPASRLTQATPPLGSLADLPEQPGHRNGVTLSRTSNARLAVPVLPAAPEIDGDLEDAAWAMAAPLEPFTTSGGTSSPTAATAAFIGQRDGRLYLAFRADEPLLDSLVTHYPAAWRNDCVEIFIDPDNRRTSFAHLIAASHGQLQKARTVQDEWGEGERDEAWSPRVAYGTGRVAGAWTAELALDLADVGNAAANPIWGFDAARERKPGGGENSVWTAGRFKAAGQFGEIVLTPADLTLAGGTLRNWSTRPIAASVEVVVSAPRKAEWYATWEDKWMDLTRQTLDVRVPGASGGQPGVVPVITPDLTLRVPPGGRVMMSLLNPGPDQFEELVANPVAQDEPED